MFNLIIWSKRVCLQEFWGEMKYFLKWQLQTTPEINRDRNETQSTLTEELMRNIDVFIVI